MSVVAILSMIFSITLVIGGFIFFLAVAIRKDRKKRSS